MKQSYMNNLVLIIMLSFGVLFGLTGCKESERDRVLMYQKGHTWARLTKPWVI